MGIATATLGTSGFDRHPILAGEHRCVAPASQDAARFLRELYRVAERLAPATWQSGASRRSGAASARGRLRHRRASPKIGEGQQSKRETTEP
jgi:hypothetical protein